MVITGCLGTELERLRVTSGTVTLRELRHGAPDNTALDVRINAKVRVERTLIVSTDMYAVSSNPTRWGAGWNMDRWVRTE